MRRIIVKYNHIWHVWVSYKLGLIYFLSGVIFVIDSTNTERICEAHEELAKLMAEKRLKDALLLIYANKQV